MANKPNENKSERKTLTSQQSIAKYTDETLQIEIKRYSGKEYAQSKYGDVMRRYQASLIAEDKKRNG